jgi:hypothetical protein
MSMPELPIDVYPFVLAMLLVAVTAAAMELRSSLQAPSCPRCVHCRHAAMERRNEQERERRALAKRLWGIDETEDEDRRRP